MAISLIKRPIGHKLAVTAYDATAYDLAGDVGIYTGIAHGLSDGDYIYIDSNIDAYNGFRYVDSIAYDTFKVKESENGDYIQFKQAVELTFYISVLNHYWQCVHLPIVYELESDIFPNNVGEESYNPNTVASFVNNAGYVQLNLTTPLSDPEELTKIELVGGTMAGVYQILTVLQPWSVVIDLVYSASYSFSGSVVVKYYDNYAINVNVYAGFESGHPWESVKPFELAATLKFIPDTDNRVKFSIAEILKGYIQTRNKLDLDTLPNNTDFMVSFYIEYFETYDQSDGEEVTTFTGFVTPDDAVGYATNSMLEFKNINSGHMSDYVGIENYPAPWLTLFDTPIIIIGQFFDISFINQFEGDVTIINYKSTNGIVTETETTVLTNPGKGILRFPLSGESGFDQYCIQAFIESTTEQAISLPALNTWLTRSTIGSLIDWNVGTSTPNVNLLGAGSGSPSTSEYLYTDYAFVSGRNYTITISYSKTYNSGTDGPRTISIAILNNSYSIQFLTLPPDTTPASPGGTDTVSLNFTANATSTKIAVFGTDGSDVVLTVTQATGIEFIASAGLIAITEQLCISVLEECDNTLLSDNLRLTEGDNLRALE